MIDTNESKSSFLCSGDALKSSFFGSGDAVSESGVPGDRSRFESGFVLLGVASSCWLLSFFICLVNCLLALSAITVSAVIPRRLRVIMFGIHLSVFTLDFFFVCLTKPGEPELVSEILLLLLLQRFRLSLPCLGSGRGTLPASTGLSIPGLTGVILSMVTVWAVPKISGLSTLGSDLMSSSDMVWSSWLLDNTLDSMFSITSLKLSYKLMSVLMWGISVSCGSAAQCASEPRKALQGLGESSRHF